MLGEGRLGKTVDIRQDEEKETQTRNVVGDDWVLVSEPVSRLPSYLVTNLGLRVWLAYTRFANLDFAFPFRLLNLEFRPPPPSSGRASFGSGWFVFDRFVLRLV